MQGLLLNVALFGLGLALLVKGADWLVDAAARIAKQFGVSDFVIGLTIVALGTTVPEFAASTIASAAGDSGFAVGNVIGSCITNIAVILGVSSIFVPIAIGREIYNRDGFVMLSAVILFYFFSLNGLLSRLEGALFILFFSAYILYFLATKKPYKRQFQFKRYLREYADLKGRDRFEKTPLFFSGYSYSSEILKRFFFTVRKLFTDVGEAIAAEERAIAFFLKQLLLFVLGVVCVAFGANFLVSAAMGFPINQLLVGLVFVAIGTSLPELAVAVSSLRKGLPAIMVGNIIGANISNIFWVAGAAALVRPLVIPAIALTRGFVFLLLISWLFLVFLRNNYKIERIESVTLVLLYLLFLAVLFAGPSGV